MNNTGSPNKSVTELTDLLVKFRESDTWIEVILGEQGGRLKFLL